MDRGIRSDPLDPLKLQSQIPLLRHGPISLTPIQKGYSTDRKVQVHHNGSTYLLRVYDKDQLTQKQQEFRLLSEMEALNVRCSRPLAQGELAEEGLGYMLLSYIEGEDAAEGLPRWSGEEQYRIGMEAGHELAKIHRLPAPAEIAPWAERLSAKATRYRQAYEQCGVRVKGEERLLDFIDTHLHVIEGRPQTFQHDDFHVGNLIVKDKALSGVIDFNRFDWGDPVHDFLKVGMFSREVSVPFSIGQIRAYHGGRDPDGEFWTLYALYVALCLVSSVVWILRVKPDELEGMLERIDRVMEDHSGFEQVKPIWYA